ncbi:MAG: phage/plasmid primase, P4 family, partial [Psychrobacillus psychrodurans]
DLNRLFNVFENQTNSFINEPPILENNHVNYEELFRSSSSTITSKSDSVEKDTPTKKHFSADKIAQYFINEFNFILINNFPQYWDIKKSYYIALTAEKADSFFRKNIPTELKSQINSRSIYEIYRWILSDSPKIEDSELYKNKQKLIAFNNGIFNVKKGKLLNHNNKYHITSVINANYSDFPPGGDTFLNFVDDICKGDLALQDRLQELFGYVVSEVRNIKVIPFLLGPKDSGKSVILRLLEHLVGSEYYTSISIDQLNRPEYLAQLYGMKLNTCAEMQEISLTRLDIIKKLTGGDSLTAKPLYSQPFKFINSAALIFAGNSLPKIKGTDNHNAFAKRIELFIFLNSIPKENQDPQLFDKLLNEMDYIAKWSVTGFIRWKNNNYNFSPTNSIDDALLHFERYSNSVQAFLNEKCTILSNAKIFSSDLYDTYIAYCGNHDLIPISNIEFQKFLTNQFNIEKTKFRMNNENRNGYIGITLNSYN